MRVAITGAGGFLGRHLCVRLSAERLHEIVAISRTDFVDRHGLAKAVGDADVVCHLAGVNRGEPSAIETENQDLATRLVAAIDEAGVTPSIVYANSVHAGTNTPYGQGKARAAAVLTNWAADRGTRCVDIVLPNLYGEGGRPDYNSFVATFCDRLASGRRPEIQIDRPLELLHAQDAAQVLIHALAQPRSSASTTIVTHGVATTVADVLARLTEIAEVYQAGTFPDLSEPFATKLFNTYRSFLFPSHYPFLLTEKTDLRGTFVESVKCGGGQSQTSYSTTAPGVTRGNHFHLEKVERFHVLKGQARIVVRPVCGSAIHVFEVSGTRPAFVDIPTLHTHNITNTGDGDLYTLFWTNAIYDAAHPDTFMEPV